MLLSVAVLYAQEEVASDNENIIFYKNEIKASLAPSLVSRLWLQDDGCDVNLSLAYLYRPVKWFWTGVNFVLFLGDRIHYDWREYATDGSFNDFSKSKIKYCAVVAPEIRFSFLNKERVIFYSALSIGVAFEDGYDSKGKTYPKRLPYYQITCFGVSGSWTKNKDIFFGGELGFGRKSLISLHCGYRF